MPSASTPGITGTLTNNDTQERMPSCKNLSSLSISITRAFPGMERAGSSDVAYASTRPITAFGSSPRKQLAISRSVAACAGLNGKTTLSIETAVTNYSSSRRLSLSND